MQLRLPLFAWFLPLSLKQQEDNLQESENICSSVWKAARVQGSSPGKQKPSLWLQDSGSICSSHVTSGKRLHLCGLCHLGDGRPLQSCSLQSHRQIQRYIETPWAPQLSWGSAIRTQRPFSDAPGSSYLRPGSREELQISSHWDDGHTYTRPLPLWSTSLPTTGSHGA